MQVTENQLDARRYSVRYLAEVTRVEHGATGINLIRKHTQCNLFPPPAGSAALGTTAVGTVTLGTMRQEGQAVRPGGDTKPRDCISVLARPSPKGPQQQQQQQQQTAVRPIHKRKQRPGPLSAMRLASQSTWALVGASGYLSAVASAAGVLDIGLVFPRTNATYSPSDDFPIVFAMQNSKLAEHLNPTIWYQVLNMTGDTTILVGGLLEFNWTSASEHDPYFSWSPLSLGGESKLRILWQPRWTSCDQSHQDVRVVRNRTDNNFVVDFEVKASGQKVDLVAATNSGSSANCPNEGVGIDVTDKTLEGTTDSLSLETCAVLGTSSPTPVSNPCKVKIDKAAAESMAAVDLEQKCRGLDQPSECPKSGLANPSIAVAGVSTLVAAFGAALFLV